MAGCPAVCGHRAIVTAYREERQRQEQAAEDASKGYAAEYADRVREHPLITFKQWLTHTKRREP